MPPIMGKRTETGWVALRRRMARNRACKILGFASNSRVPRHPNDGLTSRGSGKYGSSLSLPISSARITTSRGLTGPLWPVHPVLLFLRGKMILDEKDKLGPIQPHAISIQSRGRHRIAYLANVGTEFDYDAVLRHSRQINQPLQSCPMGLQIGFQPVVLALISGVGWMKTRPARPSTMSGSSVRMAFVASETWINNGIRLGGRESWHGRYVHLFRQLSHKLFGCPTELSRTATTRK